MSAGEWRLLEGLGDPERRQLLQAMRRRRYAAGEVVFHEGDPADCLHVIAEGRVVARVVTESGDRVAFTVMGPGEAFGEVAMLSAQVRRTSTVEALEPTVTLVVGYPQLEGLVAGHPELARVLLGLLAERVERLSRHLVEALHVPADRRVARRLLDLCERHAAPPQEGAGVGLPVTVLVTQTELGELAGASRPTTNRVLRRLEAGGALSLGRGRITVHDLAAVRRAAGLPHDPDRRLTRTWPRSGSSPG